MPQLHWRPPTPRWVAFLVEHAQRSHAGFLRRYLGSLGAVVLAFSLLFHLLMALEGRSHPWWLGPYWSVSTMTTLGLGDVVFSDWPGHLLTAVAVITGVVFMLVLLPLLLIQFPPWVEAQAAARAPRVLPRDMHGHAVFTHFDPVTSHLIRRLRQHGTPYVVLAPTLEKATLLRDRGFSVIFGDVDHPETYRSARLEQAALLAATGSDVVNANAVFTARSVAPDVPILATADRAASRDVLQLAGATQVLELADMLARALARRVLGGDALTHVVGHFDELLIAEANAAKTPLVGKRLRETRLWDLAQVSVVGVWDRGEFKVAGPETEISPHTALVLAGTRAEFDDYDMAMAIYNVSAEPVLVLGGGRVGRATARALRARGIGSRIVERDAALCTGDEFVQGDASDLGVLESAGILRAPSVVITTHDDDTNVFLALFCRRLRPDLQVVSRATFDKNVETLHRAGTDFVVSQASMGAEAIFNLLEGAGTLMLSEGLNLFTVATPSALAEKSLAALDLRQRTGCTVVALRTEDGMRMNPDPEEPLPDGSDLVMIGTSEAEAAFFEHYGE